MARLLKLLQKNRKIHDNLRMFYGKTVGIWWLKDWYLKNIGLYNGKKRLKLLPDEESEKLVIKKLKSKEPFALARYGTTEFRALFNNTVDFLSIYSGFFPNDDKYSKKFKEEYMKYSKNIDILSIWNYRNHFMKKRKLIKELSNLKYVVSTSVVGDETCKWIKHLEGKKVLVIHPFKTTIENQYKKNDILKILPKLKRLEVIRAVQTIAGNKDKRFKSWFEALEFMKNEINKKDFDVALIGCGAYGLPLAVHAKLLGKQGIHIGGSLQLFFGIKGKRWEEYKKFTKDWVYPSDTDTPKNIKLVEGGCYWK